MRISFTGEHSYEINVQASYGKDLWEKCIEAGKSITSHLMELKQCIY